ncbi:MAG TPA: TetR/AcrR family transcriptional regulator [Candidatus Limnocylindrales bacterium]
MTNGNKMSQRSQKALQTRRRIIEAAHTLFVRNGYGTTNLAEIAAEAGVAPQTIYFVFGNKRNLLKEVVDTGIAGDDQPTTTMQRSWFTDALATKTATEHLRAHIKGTHAILRRVADLTKVLATAAAMDPAIAQMWPQAQDPRYVVSRAAAQALMRKPGARATVSADEAADILFGLLSPELYLLLVRERGWHTDKWERWAFDTLRTQLTVDT